MSDNQEEIEQVEPTAPAPSDSILGGNFLSVGHLRSPQHKEIIRALDTYLDEIREDFENKILEFVEVDRNTGQRVIIYNPFKPEVQGTVLVNADSFLYELCEIGVIVCYDKKFNSNIALLVDEKNKRAWNATIPEGETKIAIKLANKHSKIAGVGLTFDDATSRDYEVTVSFITEGNVTKSQLLKIKPSSRTNNKQFFALNSTIDNISRVTIDLKEITTDSVSTYNLRNISIFSTINRELLRSMADNNIIEFFEIDNPIFLKEAPQEDLSIFENSPIKE